MGHHPDYCWCKVELSAVVTFSLHLTARLKWRAVLLITRFAITFLFLAKNLDDMGLTR